jgi:hypothetical protein
MSDPVPKITRKTVQGLAGPPGPAGGNMTIAYVVQTV